MEEKKLKARSPLKIKDELQALENRFGRLTPLSVIDAAKDEKSELHKYFEWDDSKAGVAWRIEQARELIRSVRIDVQFEERIIRTIAYVHDPNSKASESRYVNVLRVKGQTALDMMHSELSAVSADLSRVVGLAEAKAMELPNKLGSKVIAIKVQIDRLLELL